MKKVCTNCNIQKDLEEFHKREKGKFGRHAECKICLRDRQKKVKREWDEVQKENRRDKERTRRRIIKHVIDYARKVGQDSINPSQKSDYAKHCSEFIKRKCRLFLNTAVQHGWVVKPTTCSECNKKSIIHGHHEDYSKPLEVQWLCPKCHAKRGHNKRNK
jgi:hypothetical protein